MKSTSKTLERQQKRMAGIAGEEEQVHHRGMKGCGSPASSRKTCQGRREMWTP